MHLQESYVHVCVSVAALTGSVLNKCMLITYASAWDHYEHWRSGKEVFSEVMLRKAPSFFV
jgi:hypothetical protein